MRPSKTNAIKKQKTKKIRLRTKRKIQKCEKKDKKQI